MRATHIAPLRAAFTLVEIVIAVAVAAIAMAIAGAAVAGAHALFGHIADTSSAFDSSLERDAALETLRMDLASALPSQEFPFSGDSYGFRALRLVYAGEGEFEPVLVVWGRSVSGGTERRELSLSGALLSSASYPQSFGPLSLRYRALEAAVESGEYHLASQMDSWAAKDSADFPLPAMVEVRWCGYDLSLPVHCAIPPETEANEP